MSDRDKMKTYDQRKVMFDYLKRRTIEDGECWVWYGNNNSRSDGYTYGIIVRNRKQKLVHRLMYEIIHDITLTRKQFIHHKCETTLCINPDHLEMIDPSTHRKMHWAMHHGWNFE